MLRLTCRTFVLLGFLGLALVGGESSAQSMKKRGGATVDMDGFKSQPFDYWKAPDKEKVEKPVLGKYTLPKGKDYPADGEILVKELGSSETADDVFAALKKQMKPPEGKKIDDVSRVSEVKKDGPKITQLVITNGTFTDDAPKAKELKEARVSVAVVETKDKKYLVRLVAPRQMYSVVAPDLDTFLKDLKK